MTPPGNQQTGHHGGSGRQPGAGGNRGMIPCEILIMMVEAVTIVTGIMIGGTVTVKAGVHEMVRDNL